MKRQVELRRWPEGWSTRLVPVEGDNPREREPTTQACDKVDRACLEVRRRPDHAHRQT